MKVITLLPVKNESWILKATLQNMSDFSDHIIIADQNSTDGSLRIYKEFPKVIFIKNNNQNHNNSVRWQLLEYARKKFGVSNLILCVDADEMISPDAISYIKKYITNHKTESLSFSFPWIQLWGSPNQHRIDSVWKNNFKNIAFFDNGKVDYERKTVLNDHTSRIPRCEKEIKLNQFPLLHYQYINLKQSEIKQAWYRCSELILGNKPKKINYKYSITKNNTEIVLKPTKSEWFKNLPIVNINYKIETDWKYREILDWFNSKSILFFESLDIWGVQELYDRFITEIKRPPKIKQYPPWLILLNSIKNKFKKICIKK